MNATEEERRIFRQNIRGFRTYCGLSVEQLAQKIRMGPKRLADIEEGRVFDEWSLVYLGAVFGVCPPQKWFEPIFAPDGNPLIRTWNLYAP